MGSFFSGTDDANDKTGIYYSAVIGKLTDTTFEYVIRFNLYEQKKKCTLDEVFLIEERKVEVPPLWLDQVCNVSHFPVPHKNSFHNTNQTHRESLWDQRSNSPMGYSELDPEFLKSAAEEAMVRSGKQGGKRDKLKKEVPQDGLENSSFVPGPLDEMAMQRTDDLPGMDDDDLEDHLGLIEKYGGEVFEAYTMVDDFLANLEEIDEALMDIIQQCYAMMTSQGRMELLERSRL
jgi:hypothetical protein